MDIKLQIEQKTVVSKPEGLNYGADSRIRIANINPTAAGSLQFGAGRPRRLAKMTRKGFASRLYYRVCCFALFFLAAAASFNGFYDKWNLRDTLNGSTQGTYLFEAMVDGTAARPFVYRQLLPMLANWIDARIPEQTKDLLFAQSGFHGVPSFERDRAPLLYHLFFSQIAQSNSVVVRDRKYFMRYAIVYVLTFLFAWISVYAMYLAGRSAGYSPAVAALAAVAMILLMPYFMRVGGYFYDYPELAFFALVVWMAYRFNWWWIVPVAALATWNKESFLLFIPTLYPILRRKSSPLSALAGTGVLGICCAVVYFLLRVRYQHNPGETVQLHFIDHFRYLLSWPGSRYPFEETTYGLTVMIVAFDLLSLVLIVWTVWRGWPKLPQAIQRHGQIAAVINFPLYLFFCVPGEIRDLSMLFVTFFLLLAANLTRWIDEEAGAVATQSV